MASAQSEDVAETSPAPEESSWHPQRDEEFFQEVGKKVESMRLDPADMPAADPNTADAPPQPVDEIQSLCMNCHEQGTTRLMLTKIPFFREVVLTSFFCPHCNFRDSEIQSAGVIQPFASRYSYTLASTSDFSRQIIKSETCTAKFVELDVEIPAGRGQITNIESLLTTLIDDLEFSQPTRRALDEEVWKKIEDKLERGRRMLQGEEWPVTLMLEDIAGNSSIQPSVDNRDRRWSRTEYRRSKEQDEILGLDQGPADGGSAVEEGDVKALLQKEMDDEIVPDEVYSFPATCPECARHCSTHMKMVDIPHFKEVVIMSTVCEHCGYRSNEVKTGGAVPSKGRRITLRVEDAEDLARDILKSESCAFSCEELNLSVQPGTLGGRFTTLEGILTQIRDDLSSQIFDTGHGGSADHPTTVTTMTGDSMATESKSAWQLFFEGMEQAIKAEKKFTVVLEDPLASSYVQNLCAPDPDPQLTIEDYERTEEEMEDLGLNDIKTEGYEQDAESDAGLANGVDEGQTASAAETSAKKDTVDGPA